MAKGFFGPPIKVRLFNKIHKDPATNCWNWLGTPKEGYGQIKRTGSRKMFLVHRVSWEIHNGPIPNGLIVCHKCDNPRCINPDHLFLGTHKDNTADMYNKGRDPLSKGTRYQPNVVGENNGRSKLNISDILYIKRTKESSKELSALYNVNISTINRVRRGETWTK